jgi:hypothetical protein
MHTWLVH